MHTNVLITGGGGAAAEFAAKELAQHGYRVTLFDKALPEEHPTFPWRTDLPFVLGDLDALGDCMRALNHAQADAIVHLGALPGPSDQWPSPWAARRKYAEDETMRTNTMGTYSLMEAARRLGVRKVVFASTFYVLGLGNRISGTPFAVDYLPIDEAHPLRPEDSYGLSKLLCEEILKAYSRAYDIRAVALRLMGIDHQTARGTAGGLGAGTYNPPARPGYKGGPVGTTHQYVDVRDVALVCRLALEAEGLEPFEAFYIATDSKYSEEASVVVARHYPDLARMASNLQGTEGLITIRKAREKLGYAPRHSWRMEQELAVAPA
ncbi:MAG: NAD(P)-dependent oxidoreductase [Kiritimatiellae bacterium]|nr:NAD(P)-dependent oxidoreductase [Kiritimatiellia bacterium]